MSFTLGFIIVGSLLIAMALLGSRIERLPLSTAMLYVVFGVLIGPAGMGLIDFDPIDDAAFLERAAEIAVIVSLFSAGLKLRTPLRDRRWLLPLRLATISMFLTIGMVALAAYYLLDMPLGLAVLLGAILAPTDPVLASDVQVREPGDRDRLRFGLTGEAGLNDGTAFPFVMLGLGLLHLHELGGGWRWFAVDLVWASAAGLAIGAALGTVIGYLVVYLRRTHHEALGLDNFLALGLIALSYGVALLVAGLGFLAVFAAGIAMRRIEARERDERPYTQPEVEPEVLDERATDPREAPAVMAHGVLAFNEQVDRIGEVAIMLLVGSMLSFGHLGGDALWFVPLLLLVVRPLAVYAGILGTRTTAAQRRLFAWFGVRGIGSVYYLAFAVVHELPEGQARQIAPLVLAVVAVSVVVHGISVTPLMSWYEARHTPRHRELQRPAQGDL